MKITYVLNSGNFGGMEWHVIFLAEGMVKKGHTVYVWCPDGPIVAEFTKVGAQVTKQKIGLFYIFKLVSFLKKNKIDILHAHELKAAANSLLAGFLAGVKIRISHTHTPISEWRISKSKKMLDIMVYSLLVNVFSTKEIALTESRKRVKVSEGIMKNKLKVIESANAVKIHNFALDSNTRHNYREEIAQRFSIPNHSFLWGCIGRISKEKGHALLLEAFHNFYKSLTDAEKEKNYLIFAGGGPLENELREKVLSYGLGGKVIITGVFPPEDQIKYFTSLDCLVHPSLAEGFGMVLIEAMVSGVPVLASDLEVFQEVSGGFITTFSIGNAQDLSTKMTHLSDNLPEVRDMANKAQSRAISLYSFENFIDSYEKFYLSLI